MDYLFTIGIDIHEIDLEHNIVDYSNERAIDKSLYVNP